MWIDTSAGRTSYELCGPDGAPVVTFVHGLGASLAVWAGQAERLRDRYRVLRYDLRSHGASDAVDRACTRSDLAGDLISLLDALSIEKTAVVGHSAGGVIAMHAAVEHPARVSALGLIGTASECNEKTAAWYEKTAQAAAEHGGEGAMKEMGMKPDSGPVPDGRGFSHMPRAMLTLHREPLTEAMRSVTMPTIIIVGEKDFLGAGGSVILSRAVEGSRLEIVSGRGHALYLQDPDGFAAMLGGFLDEALAA